MKKQHSSKSLRIVRHFFPNVTKVTDANKPLDIEVTFKDNTAAKLKDHGACAMAQACKRMTKADGVIMAMNVAYLVWGNEAVRYSVPRSVQREIVSFDRKAGFDVGEYRLTPFSDSQRIGANRGGANGEGRGGSNAKYFKHITKGVRAQLGSRRQDEV